MVKSELTVKFNRIIYSENSMFNIMILGFLFAVASVPIFIVEIPAMGDYVNHLARSHVIASLESDPLLGRYYEIRSYFIPNIGMDIVVPLLAKLFDIYTAGKIFVLIIFALIASGINAIHYAIYKQISLAPLILFVFIYNTVLLFGFMNYLLGLGLGLWAIAAWIRYRESNPLLRMGLSLIFVLVLFFCHLYAVGLYGFSIGCFELWRLSQKGIKEVGMLLRDAAVLAVPFIVVILLLTQSPTGKLASGVSGLHPTLTAPGVKYKFESIEWLIGLYHYHKDRIIGTVIAALSCWALGKGLLRVHPVGWIISILGVILYGVMPNKLFYSWAADYRLPIAILFIFIGFTQWKLSNFSKRAIFIGAVFLIVFVRVIQVSEAWATYDREYAEIRKAFKYVAPGSTILKTVIKKPPPLPYRKALPLNHSDCLAIIDRSAYTPHFFGGRKAFSVKIKPEYNDLRRKLPAFLLLSDLLKTEENATEKEVGASKRDWKKRFDYLYVLYTNHKDVNPSPDNLELIYKGNAFTIYKIIKTYN